MNSRSTFLPHPGFPVPRNQDLSDLFCVMSHTSYPSVPLDTHPEAQAKSQKVQGADRASSPVSLFLVTKQGGNGRVRAEAQTILNLWLAVPDQVVLEEPGPWLLHFLFQHTLFPYLFQTDGLQTYMR